MNCRFDDILPYMQELSDTELIQKYINGEQAALEQLIQRYFKQVFFFAKSYVKTDSEAEDVTQETFVKAWKNIKKFDQEKKFKTWLFQITKNTSIDFLRKNKKYVAPIGDDTDGTEDNLEQMPDLNPLPEELFDSLDFEKKFDQILNDLPENYKQVVSLYFQQDLTFAEIADVLNEPLNTVKSRYRRALLKIREDYKTG